MHTKNSLNLPDKPAQITPAFLTSILRSAGVLRQASIVAVAIDPLVGRTRYNAQLARVQLTYDRH